jgi:2-polyprenyl-3-methyl-5-hydroxy-6-metoxy-1,4-benzoquinol methylase
MWLGSVIYRHRLIGKRAIAALCRVLPEGASRRLRGLAERAAFSLTPQYQGDTLPPIFHYWSGRYLAPEAQRHDIESPEAFYFARVVQAAAATSSPVQVLSVGAGAASMEIELCMRLHAAGVPAHITCVDFNPGLMRQALALAAMHGVRDRMAFVVADCNRPFDLGRFDVIVINHFFHHVTALEIFCRSLRHALKPDGVLLTSDIIGRNGHQLWPAIEAEVQRFWAELPAAQRHDRHFSALKERYCPIDHAAYSNEGVRAQDVVSCLLAEFEFEVFFSFGGAIMPFVERRVGFNFDPTAAADCAFIDRVHAADAAAIAAGRYPASNMIAALRHRGTTGSSPVHAPISAQQHAALTREQLRLLRPAPRSAEA